MASSNLEPSPAALQQEAAPCRAVDEDPASLGHELMIPSPATVELVGEEEDKEKEDEDRRSPKEAAFFITRNHLQEPGKMLDRKDGERLLLVSLTLCTAVEQREEGAMELQSLKVAVLEKIVPPQVEASCTAGHGTPTPPPAQPKTSRKAPRVWVPPEDVFGGQEPRCRQQGITNFAKHEQRCNEYKELLQKSRVLTKDLEEQKAVLLWQKPSRDVLHQLQDVMRMVGPWHAVDDTTPPPPPACGVVWSEGLQQRERISVAYSSAGHRWHVAIAVSQAMAHLRLSSVCCY